MTLAERLLKSGYLGIPLGSKVNGVHTDDYVAQFRPDDEDNPLRITEKGYAENEPIGRNGVFLSHESAVELAKFLKRIFLDESPGK